MHFREHNLTIAQTQLEILLGRYPAAEIESKLDIPQIDPVRIDAIPSSLFARRPDLAASKARLVAAELRSTAAWKEMLPGLRISGSAGWREGDVDMISDPETLIWSIAGGFVQPIFQGGQLRAQAEAAEARGQAALANYTLTLLDALRDVEIVMSADRQLEQQLDYLKIAAEQSEQAERIALDQYTRGLIDILHCRMHNETV